LTNSYAIFLRQNNQLRRAVEFNRNWSLIFAYLLFIFISDLRAVNENPKICAAATFVTHLMWLAVFGWTGKTLALKFGGEFWPPRSLTPFHKQVRFKFIHFFFSIGGIPSLQSSGDSL